MTDTTIVETDAPDTEPVPSEEEQAFSDELNDEAQSGVFVGKSKLTQRYISMIEIALDTQNTPFLRASPGVGKTAIINAIARKRGMLLHTLLGSTMDPTDVGGLPATKVLPDGEVVTVFTQLEWFKEVVDFANANPQGAIIFIDEITTTTPPVQAALLTFIQDRRIGKYKLPDNVLIIAAGNPPEEAADGWQLAPPTANRLIHINYEPSIPDWFAGMRVAWNKPKVTQRELTQRSFMVGFLTANKKYINDMPSDPEEASQAWPSMRSWDNAAQMLGRVEGGDMILARKIAVASVGKEVGDKYIDWIEALIENPVPDYNDIINDPYSIGWNMFGADALYVIMSLVVDYVTDENFEDTIKVFEAALGSRKPDVIASLIVPLKNALAELPEYPQNRDFYLETLTIYGKSLFQKLR
jgi:hypothetical protein